QVDDVPDAHVEACPPQAGLELELAAGVGRQHHRRSALLNVLDLSSLQGVGAVAVHDVVDARAAAAERGLTHLDQIQARLPQPQQSACTTSCASGSSSRAAMVRRARSRAVAVSPLWTCSAPQQPCLDTATTSAPVRASARAVARSVSAKAVLMMQPAKSATCRS